MPAEIINIEPAVGRIPKRERVFDRKIVKTFLRRQQDRVPRVVLNRRGVAQGSSAVHKNPIVAFFPSGPQVMNGVVHDDGVGCGRPLWRFAGKYRIAFLDPLETCEHVERYGVFGCSDRVPVRTGKSRRCPETSKRENREQNDESD